jgi:two-component system sensor histidine kinase TctE
MLVRGHAGLIKEALGNLLHNAVRHTTAGGHITVGLHWGDEGRTACLRVTDDGTGVPAAELPHLGERYFRASNSQGTGSGLGLAIVHNIVARHGGEVQVDAGPQGQGLAVTLCLPAAPPAAA